MILGFDYTKITVERKNTSPTNTNVRVKHDLHVTDVQHHTMSAFANKKALTITFTFHIIYEPDYATINLNGNLHYTAPDKAMDDAIQHWNDKKKLPPDLSAEVVDNILLRCNAKALQLGNDVNLPPHIPLPKLDDAKPKKDYSAYIG